MKLDIKKAFGSVNNIFLIKALDKYGFKEDFMKRIRILIQNQIFGLLMQGHQQIISNVKAVLDKSIQSQHMYLHSF